MNPVTCRRQEKSGGRVEPRTAGSGFCCSGPSGGGTGSVDGQPLHVVDQSAGEQDLDGPTALGPLHVLEPDAPQPTVEVAGVVLAAEVAGGDEIETVAKVYPVPPSSSITSILPSVSSRVAWATAPKPSPIIVTPGATVYPNPLLVVVMVCIFPLFSS